MSCPTVSICLPTLNARSFLKERIDSLLNQTLTDWDLIICDSFSNDGTWEYLQQYQGDSRFHLFRVPREGLYAGWNECLRRCSGEYIYIATADDTCAPRFLEFMVEGLRRAPVNVQLAVCDLSFIDGSGMTIPHSTRWLARTFYGDWLLERHIRSGKTEFLIQAALGIVWWSVTAFVFHRTILDRIGLFRIDRGTQADGEWEMRAALASDILYLSQPLATWRVHGDQATATIPPMCRDTLDSLEAVLNDPCSGIPKEWQEVEGWKSVISHVARTSYLGTLHLYRGNLRRNPQVFLQGVARAFRREPLFLLRQCMNGFSWDPKHSPDPFRQAASLIRIFDCEWPPRALGHRPSS